MRARHLTKGAYSENVSTGIDVYTLKQPLGVVGIISPFNFPAMVPLWFFPIAHRGRQRRDPQALARRTRSAANWMAALLKEAGPARRRASTSCTATRRPSTRCSSTPTSRAISFVGSTPDRAVRLRDRRPAHGKRVQALGGAKNHMLVLPDADLDLAADAAVNAGFGSAGERCMAISVVLAVDSVADELVEKISERMATLRTGDGTRGCDMGPLITQRAPRQGRRVHRRRHRPTAPPSSSTAAASRSTATPTASGSAPPLIDNVPTSSTVYTDEIFGPVLSVVRVDGYEEGLGIINGGQYGNGTAIFTNDGGAARRFQREVQVGMIGINVPIPVPVAYHSFGGWKASLFGDAKAYGPHGLDFFTREKAVTSRWLDPSHGGLNLGFPQND